MRAVAARHGVSLATVQRWVVRRSTMVLTLGQALAVDFRTQAWSGPPYNGMTVYRPDFDSWLAGHAVAADITSMPAHALVATSAERVFAVGVRPGAGQQHHADALVLPRVAEGLEHLRDRLRSEGIALVRPVDCDFRDSISLVVENIGVCFA